MITQTTLRSRVRLLAVVLLVAGLAALLVDVPLALALRTQPLPKELGRIFNFAEIGAHGTGAAMILVGALAISSLRWGRGADRRCALRLIAGTYLGGITVALVKLLLPRVRPRAALLDADTGVLETFGRHLLEAGDHSSAALMSFPSGHAAVAAGLAASLCWFYPGGRRAFIGLGILASLQRVTSTSHYLSDICVGAAIGLVGAWLCMPRTDRQIPAHAPQP